ncbi:trophoblast glycoprotein-like isoform X1 [Rhynchophorus ferrugineus]|uniref:trophoblast glycoprotein-like isoform X1 n=2 Tax=Rhynchophorus ferrugineus TaxID=354439 RepID=UPI003FCCF415
MVIVRRTWKTNRSVMMILLLLFSLLLFQGGCTCPVQCDCTETSVLCEGRSLTQIPTLNVEGSPAILDLSGNQFTFLSIGDLAFPGSGHVVELFLNNSGIADICGGVFDSLENLQELYLGGNFLSSIGKDIVARLDGLVVLEMSNNYFYENMPVLISESLEVLSMANSKISNIPDKALSYLPNLKLLLLQQNDLQTISMEVFRAVPADSLFMRLSFNPWVCNCANVELFRFLDNKSLIDRTDPYHCLIDSGVMDIYGKTGRKFARKHCNKNMDLDDGLNESRAMIDENRKSLETPIESKRKHLDAGREGFEKNLVSPPETITRGCALSSITIFDFYLILVIAIISGFVFGAILSILCYNIRLRYRKLEPTSDSKVELLQKL